MIQRVLLVLLASVALVVVAGIFSAGRACAHDPRFACSPRPASNPILISDPAKSWAFYGRLAGGGEDRYVVKTAVPQQIPANILIDTRDTLNPARPRATFYDVRGKTLATLDMRYAQPFYEPFSRVHYLSSPIRVITFQPGTTTIVIAMRGGNASQRYTFALGRDERFDLLEIAYLGGALYRIHNRKY